MVLCFNQGDQKTNKAMTSSESFSAAAMVIAFSSQLVKIIPSSKSGQIPAHVSPGEAAGIIAFLKDKSVGELRKLLSDRDAYQQFLLSLNQVKIQNNIKDELRRETLQLAISSLLFMYLARDFRIIQKSNIVMVKCKQEPQIMELRNQCRIFRTSELATAQEKLNELERQKEEILKFYSPGSLLNRLQEAMNQAGEESEALQEKEIDTAAFL